MMSFSYNVLNALVGPAVLGCVCWGWVLDRQETKLGIDKYVSHPDRERAEPMGL